MMVFKKGNIPWSYGKRQSIETKNKISQSKIGSVPWNKGKTTGLVPSTAFKKGLIPWNKGIKSSKELIRKRVEKRKLNDSYKKTELEKRRLSILLKGKNKGEKNGQWMGGISFEPYGNKWREDLRNSIRKRDNFTCQLCKNNGNSVHHINYIKTDCNPNNLLTLCKKCHAKTNRKRNFWEVFLLYKNIEREMKK